QRLNGRLPVYFQGKIRDGITLKSYLYPIDLTLTGRMHFGISGLSLNKPMFGLAYEGKFDGLQHLFGIDPEKSLAKNLHALSSYGSMFDDFIRKLESNKYSIDNRYDSLIALSKDSCQAIRKYNSGKYNLDHGAVS